MRLKILAVISVISVLAIIIIAGRAPGAFDFIQHVPGKDKTGHFFLMGLLTLIVNLALKMRAIELGKLRIYLASFIIFGFLTIEEFSQIFISTRTFDLADLTANYLGIVVFSIIARWVYRRYFLPPEKNLELS